MTRSLLPVAVCAAKISLGGATAAGADLGPPDLTPDGPLEADPVFGQQGPLSGHLLATSANVQLVGKLRVHGAAEGIVSDVGTLRGYAYLGQYVPGCAADNAGGAYVVDISNPAGSREVEFIPDHPGSYVSEGVHAVHTAFFTGDVLALNNEICGAGGLGGVSLRDITNPIDPNPLAENFGDTKPRARSSGPRRGGQRDAAQDRAGARDRSRRGWRRCRDCRSRDGG
jgi:hypothetical protein